MSAKLLILAGPNGSGKSTLYNYLLFRYKRLRNIPFINPDLIAESFNENKQKYIKAAKTAIRNRKNLLKEHKSFAIETTLSGNSEIDLIYNAFKKGYQIYIIYISLDDPFLNIQRVKARVSSGGHEVLPIDIIRRYKRSLKNMKKVVSFASAIYIFDNTSEKFKLISSYRAKGARGNKYLIRNTYIPNWAKSILDTIDKYNR